MTPLTNMWEETPAIEGRYEYNKDEHYQNNNMEEQVMSEPSQNPQRRMRKRKACKKPALESKLQQNYVNGRLGKVGVNNIQGATKVYE